MNESSIHEAALARVREVCAQVEANPVGWGGDMAVSLARTILRAAEVERTCERHDLSWTAPVDMCPECQDEITPPTDHAAAPTSERGA